MKKLLIGGGLAIFAFALSVNFAFAAVGPLQSAITYYTGYTPTFARSATPFTSGVTTQSDNPDGSVTMSVTGATGYADSGFVIYDGKLGDLNNFNLTGSGDYGLNLWFDVDNDGEYFVWNSDVLTSPGADKYILGPSSNGGNISLTGSSQFTSMQPGGGNYTLAQLKAGDASDITSGTHIAIWVGVTVGSSGSETATVSLLGPQPTSKDDCKKNDWKTFNNPSFKNQGACVSYIQSNENSGKKN